MRPPTPNPVQPRPRLPCPSDCQPKVAVPSAPDAVPCSHPFGTTPNTLPAALLLSPVHPQGPLFLSTGPDTHPHTHTHTHTRARAPAHPSTSSGLTPCTQRSHMRGGPRTRSRQVMRAGGPLVPQSRTATGNGHKQVSLSSLRGDFPPPRTRPPHLETVEPPGAQGAWWTRNRSFHFFLSNVNLATWGQRPRYRGRRFKFC